MKNSEQYHLILRWTIKLQRTWHILIYIYMNDRFTNNNTFYFDIDFRYLRAILLHFMNRMRKPSLNFLVISVQEVNTAIQLFSFHKVRNSFREWIEYEKGMEPNYYSNYLNCRLLFYMEKPCQFFLILLNLQAC